MRRLLLATFCLAALTSAFAATTFSKTTYPTGNSPFATVTADIDRDGHPDIITSDGNGYLTVLLGASGGTFIMNGTVATTGTAYQLAAGDFDNDGYPDVIAMEDHGYQLFLSTHNGSLAPQPQIPFVNNIVGESIVAVDLNKDHVPDIAFTYCPADFSSCSFATALNDHTGHFTILEAVSLGGRSILGDLTTADFDRDGLDDFAVVVNTFVKIFRSTGGGGFNATPMVLIGAPNGEPLGSPVAGDIDAKNGADLVVLGTPTCFPDCINAAPIYVYLNNGSGKLSLHQTLTSNSVSTNELKLADLTGDNRLDLVLLNGAIQMNNGSLSWAHYAGSGSFGSFSTIMQLGMPLHMTTRDLNLDSRHDIVLTDGGFGDFNVPAGTAVLTHTGSGAYCSPGPNSSVLSVALCFISHTGDTFTFEALGNSPVGVRRLELWVDGKKLYNSPDDRLKFTTHLSSGSHKTQIVAVDQFGATVHLTNTVTAP
jgi:hypothetical protein